MESEFGILDLFAGPGGLGEGFAGYQTSDGSRPFRIQLSAEYEPNAWRTLRLRAFARQFEDFRPPGYSAIRPTNALPDWASSHPREWKLAGEEAQQLKLGEPAAAVAVDKAIKAAKTQHGDRTIVIGGPPCQAYSLVGRSRNAGKEGYTLANDEKTFLFREYVRVLKKLRPAAFIMENVSGLLSAKLDSEPVFDLIRNELTRMGGTRAYELVALDPGPTNLFGEFGPADFLVKAEAHGVPQARHRLLLVGLRAFAAASACASRMTMSGIRSCER